MKKTRTRKADKLADEDVEKQENGEAVVVDDDDVVAEKGDDEMKVTGKPSGSSDELEENLDQLRDVKLLSYSNEGLEVGDNADRQKKQKRGVIYLGSLAPGLKPRVVKSLLSAHGNLTKTYLEPESDAKRKRRIAMGGSSGLRYVEGWAEFASKKEAKQVALALNGTRIGPRKGSRFYDDLWMTKYLSGFTWEMLVEKSVIERREREQRMKLELAKAKKEDEAFMRSVTRSKQMKISDEKSVDQTDKGEERKRTLPHQLAPIKDKRKRPSATDDSA